MSFDYAQARKNAQEIIGEFGAAGTFIISDASEGGYDDLGNPVPPQPAVTIEGIVTPLLRYKQHEIDGERILAIDNYVFFHSETVPQIDNKITINGNTYIAKSIVRLDSVDNINIYVKVQLRK